MVLLKSPHPRFLRKSVQDYTGWLQTNLTESVKGSMNDDTHLQ